MCGIAGVYGKRDMDATERMLGKIRHRGPDDTGIWWDKDIVLGHNRLSIIDVEGGKQPIFNENEDKCIVCNGEIYNYLDLKDSVQEHQFRTRSDTEVILHLYEKMGTSCVYALDGMFSFALWDGKDLFLARDPLGIKPLYYGRKNGVLYFASEIKALLEAVDEVHEFPAGSCFHTSEGFLSFYNLPQERYDWQDADEILPLLKERFEASVEKRLMSDVPLGVFLSGGLDSSLVSAVAKRHFKELHSFSVGIEGSADREAALEVARYLGTTHHEYVYDEDELLEVLPKVVYQLESFEPSLVRSAVPTYFVSKLASAYVKVVLSGEGSDELFAGYRYLKRIDDEGAFHQELIHLLSSLHNINLQRVDRLTMAHALEGRVPFLDVRLIDDSMRIAPELKLNGNVEKWILRKAFEGYLPDRILWRDKAQFADGSGASELLRHRAEREVPGAELESASAEYPELNLRSKEELYYFKIFRQFYDNKSVIRSVGRWQEC